MILLTKLISRYTTRFFMVLLLLISTHSFLQAQNGLPSVELNLNSLEEFQTPSENWIIAGDVYMDIYERLHVEPEAGNGILVNRDGIENSLDIFTAWEHGDIDLELEFMMAKGSNSGIYFQGRYELQMLDSWGVQNPRFGDMGGIYQWWEDGVGVGGIAPRTNASRAPGLWQHLEVKFRAPQFDENGEKIKHARLTEVILNGVMIHRNVDLIHPTGGAVSNEEVEKGPLRFQGDHGPVAFRNIRYKTYDYSPLAIQDLSYKYYSGEIESAAEISGMNQVDEGVIDQINLQMLRESGEFAIHYSGSIEIEQPGDYFFDLRSDGGHQLSINDEVVFEADDSNRAFHSNPETIYLDSGNHEIELIYFRGARGGQPALGIMVEGPGIMMHSLHDPASLRRGTENIPLLITPSDKPVLIHGFMDMGERVHTHTAAVGYPGGVNFALDQNSGSLMKIWKGDFLNAGSMWVGRGGRNLSLNENTAVTISAAPSLAALNDENHAWPDLVQDDANYRFNNYIMSEDGHLIFNYQLSNRQIQDVIKPKNDGKELNRTLTFQNNSGGSSDDLYLMVAQGDQIRKLPNNLYEVDDKTYFIRLHGDSENSAQIRNSGEIKELLIPAGHSENFSIEYSLIW